MAELPIGAVVRALRKQRGMTQREVAEAAECEARYISKIECGSYGLSIAMLARLAAALGTEGSKILRHAERLREKAAV